MQYLASPEHLQQYAFGVRHLMKSDGSLVTMPNCTRKAAGADMYQKYLANCKEEREKPESRSQFMFAVKTIAVRDQVILDSLDSVYIKCGPDNFDTMKDFVNLIACDRPLVKAQLIEKIQTIQDFMHRGLKDHFGFNKVAAHSHDHHFGAAPNPISDEKIYTEVCNECDGVRLLIPSLRLAVNTTTPATLLAMGETVKTLTIYLESKLEKNFNTYYSHVMRTESELHILPQIIENMTATSCVIVSDWKMKLLQMLWQRMR